MRRQVVLSSVNIPCAALMKSGNKMRTITVLKRPEFIAEIATGEIA